ncbi:uncharacterized protein LOC106470890 [Limulus polyphemus]|uniref:Uncharacterized protein LOC106470890 n=1 Tax=Limulus polyphemus TaxID=6850 RepID=A0ABM1TH83_LIMPO|nr:uncharacterized protein LOC106470890 [Limulus polyphemus]
MSRVKTLTDMGDGSVSNHAPTSPDPTKFLNSPISLDFDPLRFEFKEDNFESFTTSGTAGDEAKQEVQKYDIDQSTLKDHDQHGLNTQNTLTETHNRSQFSVTKSKENSSLKNRNECDSSSDEQQFSTSGSGSESDIDSPDLHSNVTKTKHFQKESITKKYPEDWLTTQRTEEMIQCADFDNKDVKSLTGTMITTYTEPDDSLVNTILRTTTKTTTCMVEDGSYVQDAEKDLPTHNNIDSKEHRVLNLLENCLSDDQNTSVGLYNESCPQEYKIMTLTEDLILDKHNFEHASNTIDKSLTNETEKKDYNLYSETDIEYDVTPREAEIEHNKTPKEVELDDDVTLRKVETEHDVTPKEVEIEHNIVSEVETEQNMTPKDLELDDDVTPRTIKIEHDVIPKEVELNYDVTPREVEIMHDVVLRDIMIENDVSPDNGKTEYSVISDEIETDHAEMSKHTEIIEGKKLCSNNIQDEKIVKSNNIPNLKHEDRVSKEHDVVHGEHVKSGSPVSDVSVSM